MEKSRNYKMYILVNSDLKMGVGKKCSQCGHAVQAVTEAMCSDKRDLLRKFKEYGQAKITLKATEEQMMELIKTYPDRIKYVLDAGHTQVAPGSLTALAFFPMLDNESKPAILNELKLL